MQDATKGKNESENAGSEVGLGRCMVEGDPETTSQARRNRGKTFGVSVMIELLLLGSLVAAPFLTSVAQPNFSRPTFVPFVFGARRVKQTPPRPLTPARPQSNHPGFPIPNLTPNLTNDGPSRPVQPSQDTGDSTAQIQVDVFPGEPGPGAPLFAGFWPSGPVAPPDAIKKNAEKRPLKLSEPVVQAQLLSRIEPRYPPLARQLRRTGTVVLHAIISRDGRIDSLEVVSGSPFFVQSAVDAVRQWRYRPTLLDGETVEVETTITVLFQLQP